MNTDNGRLNFSVGLDNSRLRQDAAETRRILESIGNSTKEESDKMKTAFDGVGKTLVGVFGVTQLVNFSRSVIQARSDIESLEKSFEILAGKAAGGKLFGEIKDFAVTTPMGMQELAKGAQTLLSFNTSAEEVMPILRAIGDIAMGDAQKFNSLVLAFSQMSSTGKLMGQDLLQMINAGFNPLSIISEQTGKSIGVLKEEMSKGSISADMIKKAFMDATSEGGKFHGMLKQQSQTLAGSISNLKGAWEEMLNEMGEKSQGVLTGAIELAQFCVQHYDAFLKVLLSIAAAYGTYKAALMAVVVLEQARNFAENIRLMMMFRKELGLLTAAQQAFNITAMKNPYILLAAAIVGVVTALYAFTKQEDETQERIDAANDRIKEQQEELEELRKKQDAVSDAERDAANSTVEQINKIEMLSHAIHDNTASVDDRRRAISQLQELVPNYHASLDDEGRLFDENKTAAEDYISSLNRLAMARALQDKREEIARQKVNAELDRRTASQGVDDARIARDNAAAIEQREQANYDRRLQEWADATIESDNWFVVGAFASPEGQMSLAATKQIERTQLDAAEANLRAAEAELEVAEGELAIADQRITNADEQLAELDAILQEYRDVDTSQTSPTTNPPTNKKKKKDPRDSTLSQIEYEQEVARSVVQSEFDIQQERINAMNEGVEKYLAQAELNYKRMMQANKEREEEMVAELRRQRQQEWENANPNATEQEKDAHELELQTTITAKDLSQEQKAIIQEYEKLAAEIRLKAHEESLNKMLDGIRTYEQSRLKIEQQYQNQRDQLYERDNEGNFVLDESGERKLREGVTQGNVDELNRQEEEALEAIDQQFAAREATYEAWCENLTTMTLDQLMAVLQKAEEELATVEASGQGGQKLATARAKVATVKEKVEKKQAQVDVAPEKRSIKEWNELREALEDCISTFDELGDAIGGVAGEIISTTGNIMGSTLSMINGIVQLVQMSSSGMTATAATASTAIQTVEKASVILAVISAALQIAMQIVQLFNNDDEKQEEIERLQGRIDQLQWELDNADIMALRENAYNSLEKVREVTAQVSHELVLQRFAAGKTGEAWKLLFGGAVNDAEALNKTVENLATAYGNVSYTADKALGSAKYDQAKNQLKNIAEQQMLIQEQIAQEESKKKTDRGKIEEWEQQIEELGAEAIQIINDMVEDIIGGSAADIAEQLGEAFFEAFEAGEDAAKAWGEAVNDIVADIMKRMLVQQFLEQPLEDIFNKYKQKWFPNGEFQGMDVVVNSMTDFANDLNGTLAIFEEIMGELPDELKQYLQGEVDATREASEKGIAAASQESVDELNGRMTAVQGHTFSISENTQRLVQTAALILNSVLNIESNTDQMEARMRNIEDDLGDVKDTVNDIALKGIKIR